MSAHVMWFRRDLRLADNEALFSAVESGLPVVPVFVSAEPPSSGLAERAWLHRSLLALDDGLKRRGSSLTMRVGSPAEALSRLAAECSASAVHCSRDWTPQGIAEEDEVRSALEASGVTLLVHEGQLLVTPPELTTASGGPYRVFTPYHRAWTAAWRERAPLPAPARIVSPVLPPATSGPLTPPAGGPDVVRWWTPGEDAAHGRLAAFVADGLADYDRERDIPSVHGTSELSPRLATGELSPRQVVHAAAALGDAAAPFLRQLAWREFSYHVLHHFPHTSAMPLRPEFEEFPWSDDPGALEAWKAGCTGYPLVDAGMRQLAATGWMHNRVRLVAGSFLAKDLLIGWQTGLGYFRDRLVDHDAAANAFNWQWVAGSGADAAPYFRVFNPTLQGTRFDAAGAYIREWVPELRDLPDRWIHRPAEAPTDVLASAGVTLGRTYPRPMVDHAEARVRALAAYSAIKGR